VTKELRQALFSCYERAKYTRKMGKTPFPLLGRYRSEGKRDVLKEETAKRGTKKRWNDSAKHPLKKSMFHAFLSKLS